MLGEGAQHPLSWPLASNLAENHHFGEIAPKPRVWGVSLGTPIRTIPLGPPQGPQETPGGGSPRVRLSVPLSPPPLPPFGIFL